MKAVRLCIVAVVIFSVVSACDSGLEKKLIGRWSLAGGEKQPDFLLTDLTFSKGGVINISIEYGKAWRSGTYTLNDNELKFETSLVIPSFYYINLSQGVLTLTSLDGKTARYKKR